MEKIESRKNYKFTNRKEFVDFIASNDYVIIKVGASWCGPCQRIQPAVDKLLKQIPKDILYVYIDADEGQFLASALKIKVLPTFLSYIKGELIDIYDTSSENLVREFFQKTYNNYLKNQ